MPILVELKLQGVDGVKKADTINRQIRAIFPTIVVGPIGRQEEIQNNNPDAFTVYKWPSVQAVQTYVVAHRDATNVHTGLFGSDLQYDIAGGSESTYISAPTTAVINPYHIDVLFTEHDVSVTRGVATVWSKTHGVRLPAGSEHQAGESLKPTELYVCAGYHGKLRSASLPFGAVLTLAPVKAK